MDKRVVLVVEMERRDDGLVRRVGCREADVGDVDLNRSFLARLVCAGLSDREGVEPESG